MANRPTSGQISLSQVRADLAASGEINMDDSDVRALTFKPLVYPTGSQIKMSDLYYQAPSFTIIPNTTSVSEGGTVIYSITAPNVLDGTILYWTNAGTTSGGDFSNTSAFNSGSVTVTGGTATLTLILSNDLLVEGAETIIILLHTDSTSGPTVATADTVTVAGTGVSYSITPDATSINEGDTVTYDITTLNVPNGTTLYWSTSGTIDAVDFTDSTLTGNVTISAPDNVNGTATITRTVVADLFTDGDETIVLELRTGSTSGTIVATATTVTVLDTSQSVVTPTYAIAPSATTVDEGDTVTFTVTTTNVTPGTTLYWNNAGTTVGADFTDNVDQGTVTLGGTLANGTATFTRTLKNDLLTEGSQTISMRLRTGGQSGTPGSVLRATAATVTVNDTSTGVVAPTYAIVGAPDPANEGDTVTFTITTTNVTDGTVLDWTNVGASQSADFVGGAMSGTVTINSNSGTITRQLVADLTTEPAAETLQIQLSSGGSVVATSNEVNINDSSTTPVAPTYALAPSVTTISEGQSVTFTVTTTNLPNTTLYWTLSTTAATPRIAAGDVAASSGWVAISGNSGTFTVTVNQDASEGESTENLVVDLRTVSTSGTIVASSTPVVQVLNSTYDMTPSATTVTEGTVVTFTVNTTNVPDGTNLYWTRNTSSTATSGDMSATQGIVTINSNTGSFTITALSDGVGETDETMIIDLRVNSYTGGIVATNTVTITGNQYAMTLIVGRSAWSDPSNDQAGYQSGGYGSLSGSTVTPYGTITGIYSNYTAPTGAAAGPGFVERTFITGMTGLPAGSTISIGGTVYAFSSATFGPGGGYMWSGVAEFYTYATGTSVPIVLTIG